MPALFAYLIALCLLLGGGYGALNWLAAPEPVKVAAKAGPKAKPPSTEARVEETAKADVPATAADAGPARSSSASATDDRGDTASIDRPASREAETVVSNVDRDAKPENAAPAPDSPVSRDPQARSARAEGTAIRSHEENAAQTEKAASPIASAAVASSAPGIATLPSQRPRQKYAGNRPQKRRLEMMTLRTIEFPDGRRVTQLIPYRGSRRVLAFGDND
jgi:hypothetical protein